MKYSLLLLILVFIEFAQAQWTLEDCIDSALVNNKGLRILSLNSSISGSLHNAEKLNFLPSINGYGSHGYNWGQTIDPFTNQFATNKVSFDQFYLSSSVVLFSGLQKFYKQKIAKLDYASNLQNIEIEKRNLTIDVISAYLQVSLNQETNAAARYHLEMTLKEKEKIISLLNAEQVTNQKLLDINALEAIDNNRLVQSQNDLKLSLLLLQQIIGCKYDTSFQISTTIKSEIDNINFDNDLEEEFLSLNQERQLFLLKLKGSQFYPHLILNGSLGSGYSGNNTTISPSGEIIPKSFNDQMRQNLYQSVSVNLNIPIFNGTKSISDLKIGKLENERVRIEGEKAIQEYENKLMQYKLNVTSTTSLLESAQKSYDANKLAFENMQLRYDSGAANISAYLQSKDLFFQSESQLIQAKYKLEFAKLILDLFD